MLNSWRILTGDVRETLLDLPDQSVQCVVTSPPYWGLRDYGVPPLVWGGDLECEHEWGDSIQVNATNHTDKRRWNHTRNGRDEEQPTEKRVAWLRTVVDQGNICQRCGAWRGALGLEPTPDLYIEHLAIVFEEVRRALKPDGVLWLNLGDCYATGAGKVGDHPGGGEQGARWKDGHRGSRGGSSKQPHTGAAIGPMTQPNRMPQAGLKPKDLVGIPWMAAFALRDAGWYLRSDVIWSKPNPMPESVTDRPTKAHEYLFLLTKSERYYYDADAILEPLVTDPRENYPGRSRVIGRGGLDCLEQSPTGNAHQRSSGGLPPRQRKSERGGENGRNVQATNSEAERRDVICSFNNNPKLRPDVLGRNKRSVWHVPTQPYPDAHFATYPEALIEPCILAGSRPGDTILDPFTGSGTTGAVAIRHQRNFIGCELNPAYVELARKRIGAVAPLLAEERTA